MLRIAILNIFSPFFLLGLFYYHTQTNAYARPVLFSLVILKHSLVKPSSASLLNGPRENSFHSLVTLFLNHLIHNKDNIYFHARFGAAIIRKTYFLPKNTCVCGMFFVQKYDFLNTSCIKSVM